MWYSVHFAELTSQSDVPRPLRVRFFFTFTVEIIYYDGDFRSGCSAIILGDLLFYSQIAKEVVNHRLTGCKSPVSLFYSDLELQT